MSGPPCGPVPTSFRNVLMSKLRASFVFTPWEGRRIIGKAVAALPVVQNAYKNTEMIIAHGSTNVFVAEEIKTVYWSPPASCRLLYWSRDSITKRAR